MSVRFDDLTDEEMKMTARLFALAGLAETMPVDAPAGSASGALSASALLRYARSSTKDPAIDRALLQNVQLRALFRRMVETWLDAEQAAMAPQAVAAATGELSVRTGDGFRLELIPDTSEEGQTYVVIELKRVFEQTPRTLYVLDDDGNVIKEGPLPDPYDGTIQFLAYEASALVQGLRRHETRLALC
jgi:hypothetical protein